MKTFLIKLFIFLAPIIIISLAFNKVFDNKIKQTNISSNYKEWNDILDSKINADLIIQGNSRSWLQISPHIIDTVLKLNSYNLGMDGYGFLMQYYRFLLYLKYNTKPEYILQNVDEITLSKSQGLYQSEQFLPYLDIPIIREAVLNYEGLGYIDIYIPFYKYIGRGEFDRKAFSSLFKDSFPPNNKYKGFLQFDFKWDTAFVNFKNKHPNGYSFGVDTMTRRLFDVFVRTCKEKDIKLIFVNTPEYIEGQKIIIDRDSILNIFKGYSKTYNIPYLDYSRDSLCYDTTYFYNSLHMNSKGVTLFNLKLANDLKKVVRLN